MDLKESGEILNKDSFCDIEQILGGVFPNEYKDFMIKHNGGRPLMQLRFSVIEHDPESDKDFQNRFKIYSFNKLEDIPVFYNNLFSSELIPEHFCPIADDSCGNEILLCVDETKNYGEIYFADHELYEEDGSWVITKIADNFNAFIRALTANYMFDVIEKGHTIFYMNKKRNLKLKADKIDDSYHVYINLNGYNPIFSMLMGGFENECEMSGIDFQVISSDGSNSFNADYCVISIKDIKAFATEVYCFIIENNVAEKLRESDRAPWVF